MKKVGTRKKFSFWPLTVAHTRVQILLGSPIRATPQTLISSGFERRFFFRRRFYIDCFKKGIGGIIIMSCGEECPYEGAYKALAKRLDRVYAIMKEHGLDIRRLRLTAICTVCNRAFLNEVNQMNNLVSELGPPVLASH